jgi:hypothetical protein
MQIAKYCNKIKCLALISSLSSCAVNPTLIEGGLMGGGAGAATGALIGSVIKDGNIIASAGVGSLIGVPAGLALGQYYIRHLDQEKIRKEQELILEQKAQMYRNERTLETMREDIRTDAPTLLDLDRRNVEFQGETLASFYR